MEQFHVIVIGGGGTGAAVIHDLTQRGLKATLLERGELTSGTTGRHHGLLHSGARYAVKDQESAIECIEENMIIRQIAPEAVESNEGLFVAISEADEAYAEVFLAGCEACQISTRVLNPKQALDLEPNLNPNLRLAVQVPDATIDAWRLPLHFFATAKHRGADIRPYAEVIGFIKNGGVVSVVSHVSGPIVFALEILFVIVVTYHALVGVRAIIFDLSLSDAARRKVSVGLTILGLATVIYGVALAVLIRSQLLNVGPS